MSTPARIALRGIEIAYEREGEGARPLLLVHGFTGSRDDWKEQIPLLAQDGEVIALDLRGHGESTNLGRADAYSFGELVADLDAFVEALEIETFDLLGHSMGGMAALRYVLEHPARVQSLILMDTSAAPISSLPKAVRDGMATLAREQGMARFAAVTKAGMQGMLARSAAAAACVERMGADIFFGRIERKLSQMDAEAFAAFGEALGDHEPVVDRLHEISLPTLAMVGAEDAPFLEPTRTFAERIPGAVHEVIEGAAHSPQLESPDAWLRAVRQHLARARRTP